MGSLPRASHAPPREKAALPLSGYSSGLLAKAPDATERHAIPVREAAASLRACSVLISQGLLQINIHHVCEEHLERQPKDVGAEELVLLPGGREDADEE